MVGRWLVCFAVRDEARHFQPPPGARCEVLSTGIGARNAEASFLKTIASLDAGAAPGTPISGSASADVSTPSPLIVLTCGYAGGLNPDLKLGQVVFDAGIETGLAMRLRELGALPVAFHCHSSIAITAADKRALRERTGADAVEMESGVIRRLCRGRGIPSATVRVISDEAGADLPLDFNRLAREDGNISYAKLAGALVRSPGKVRALLRFQRELDLAGRRLAATLFALLSAPGS